MANPEVPGFDEIIGRLQANHGLIPVAVSEIAQASTDLSGFLRAYFRANLPAAELAAGLSARCDDLVNDRVEGKNIQNVPAALALIWPTFLPFPEIDRDWLTELRIRMAKYFITLYARAFPNALAEDDHWSVERWVYLVGFDLSRFNFSDLCKLAVHLRDLVPCPAPVIANLAHKIQKSGRKDRPLHEKIELGRHYIELCTRPEPYQPSYDPPEDYTRAREAFETLMHLPRFGGDEDKPISSEVHNTRVLDAALEIMTAQDIGWDAVVTTMRVLQVVE